MEKKQIEELKKIAVGFKKRLPRGGEGPYARDILSSLNYGHAYSVLDSLCCSAHFQYSGCGQTGPNKAMRACVWAIGEIQRVMGIGEEPKNGEETEVEGLGRFRSLVSWIGRDLANRGLSWRDVDEAVFSNVDPLILGAADGCVLRLDSISKGTLLYVPVELGSSTEAFMRFFKNYWKQEKAKQDGKETEVAGLVREGPSVPPGVGENLFFSPHSES